MSADERTHRDAIRVATLYYYEGMTTEAIAGELGVSRPKVSRLLSFARDSGIVQIRVIDSQSAVEPIVARIRDAFDLEAVHVVPVPEPLGEVAWLTRVARFAANHVAGIVRNDDTLAIAWGTTISEIAAALVPRTRSGVRVVQLNGSGNTAAPDNRYAATILGSFASALDASVMLFPVPTFFDYPETKAAMWRERSVRRVIELQESADIYLYSIGAVDAGVPSHVYAHGYLEDADRRELEREAVVGDLATVFFRGDGSWADIPLNHRASGPNLELFQRASRAICVVSGRAKVPGLLAALRARYMTELIVDEPTARLLVAAMDRETATRKVGA